VLAAGVVALTLMPSAPAGAQTSRRSPAAVPPGSPLTRTNPTPLPVSPYITGAQWLSGRYDPPSNQWGDILPTVWSDDGSTYVLMDDGGTDVPLAGGFWRQSFAKISGTPPNLRFKRVATAATPKPTTWSQVGGNPDNDDGPLGPFYSIGFAEAGGVFYATQQENWNWNANGPFNGLAGIAYSTDHGKTWSFPAKAFPPPLGNLTFVDGGGPGGAYPDGYMYAIGTEREFNASHLVLGRVRTGVAHVTDPSQWQWYTGSSRGVPQWSNVVAAATPVLKWNSHITYPEMTYDAGLHRYLLTFTYSYSSKVPAVWKGGAELVIASSTTPWGPFSFVAASRDFGPSNGYGAGFPSQWISANGRQLWLKWAANFDGCAKGLDCSGKYGFNVAKIQLTVAPAKKPPAKKPPAKTTTRPKAHKADKVRTVAVVSGTALPLLLLGLLGWRINRFRRRRT